MRAWNGNRLFLLPYWRITSLVYYKGCGIEPNNVGDSSWIHMDKCRERNHRRSLLLCLCLDFRLVFRLDA